jgi:hypothetical protein
MIDVLARGCPPGTNPAQCPGPAPAESCSTAPPPGAFSPATHPGTCYSWTVNLSSPSWWTPAHIAWAAIVALCAAIILGVALALVRDRMHDRRLLRGAR